MISAVCTLFENDYHYGVGALVNSLYRNGFRGIIWAGYRGELPFWAIDSQLGDNFHEFPVADECVIRFVKLQTSMHFANYKPTFMLSIWSDFSSEIDRLCYFDPDIVIKCRWTFYEEWLSRGIAMCEDGVYAHFPSDHPIRLSWKDYAIHKKYQCKRDLNFYYNSGFIGISKEWKSALEIWRDLLEGLPEIGFDLYAFMPGDRSMAFYAIDQDVLNLMATVTEHPLSTIGPDGMDFAGGGYIMSHASGIKPWRKRVLQEAINGKAPTLADKKYWQNVEYPIQLYTSLELFWKRLDLRLGAGIGRFIRRA